MHQEPRNMASKGKRPMRALTAGDKIDAIQRVNDGESKASVARDIGVPESTLRGWCKNEDKLRYMSTRHSTPDTDRSCDAADAQPPDKRARSDDASPHAADSPAAREPDLSAGLDLSAAGLDLSGGAPAAPASPRRPDPPPPPPPPRDPPLDAASVSMSAISPLTGLNRLSAVAPAHLGMSFNDIATNLGLIAQLNPGLGALAGSLGSGGARTLRSVRSPKPSHAPAPAAAAAAATAVPAPLNLADGHRSRSQNADGVGRSRGHRATKERPVEDALWYWLKTQQAMLDLTAPPPPPAAPPRESSRGSPKPAALGAQLDLNRSSWFWQYYKQFGGAMPPPEDKLRSAAPAHAPRERSENILYSHLTRSEPPEPAECRSDEPAKATAPPAASPAERSQARARTVLDNLLFNNDNVSRGGGGAGAGGGEDACCNAENEFDGEVSDALEHGEKFLAWLEACRDPSVTRLHVHQLRGLLHNIRTRAERKPQAPAAGAPAGPALPLPDRVSRRK